MSEKLKNLHIQKGSLAILAMFGLNEIITDQDDPKLWAAVLAHHWPAPGEPDMFVEGLRFGLAQETAPDENETGSQVQSRSGMYSIEIWCFKAVENESLSIEKCNPESNLSYFMSIINADPAASTAQSIPVVKSMIDIQRPSQGSSTALVHAGISIPPNMGQGETRRWIREMDGNRVETEEIVFNWIS